MTEVTEEEFRVAFKGSPVKRAKWSGLRRDVAAALSSSNDLEAMGPLEHAPSDPEPMVRAQQSLHGLRDRVQER
jgi:epoxyqueuosine reductase QueG